MLPKEVLFSYFPKLTYKRYQDLLRIFSSLENAWEANFTDLKSTLWGDEVIQEFLEWKNDLQEEEITQVLEKENVTCITLRNKEYPPLLKEIYDPPLCLFVRGTLPSTSFSLAVVGTRKATVYGRQVIEEIVTPLAEAGITIVSGLALGIDGLAHACTLEAHGKTIAVLAGGVDRANVQPSMHRQLAEKIIEQSGALISEYPPGSTPTKYSFPRRNRIIAGLTLGTLVVEAGESSGSLITAQCALESNREVFAIPQNITSPTSVGTNYLIKKGAKPVTSPQDVLEALNLTEVKEFVHNGQILPDSPTEACLLEHLSREPIHIDELTKKSGLPSATVGSTLTFMEMKGKVKNLGGMTYVVSR